MAARERLFFRAGALRNARCRANYAQLRGIGVRAGQEPRQGSVKSSCGGKARALMAVILATARSRQRTDRDFMRCRFVLG
jgi:hypothetical protein